MFQDILRHSRQTHFSAATIEYPKPSELTLDFPRTFIAISKHLITKSVLTTHVARSPRQFSDTTAFVFQFLAARQCFNSSDARATSTCWADRSAHAGGPARPDVGELLARRARPHSLYRKKNPFRQAWHQISMHIHLQHEHAANGPDTFLLSTCFTEPLLQSGVERGVVLYCTIAAFV